MRGAWHGARQLAREILRIFEKNPERAPRGAAFQVGKVRCKRTAKAEGTEAPPFDNMRFVTPGDPRQWPRWSTHLVFQDGQRRTEGFLLAVRRDWTIRSLWESGIEEWEFPRHNQMTTVCSWGPDGRLAELTFRHPRWGRALYRPWGPYCSILTLAERESLGRKRFPRFLGKNSWSLRGLPREINFTRRAANILRGSRLREIAEGVQRDFA